MCRNKNRKKTKIQGFKLRSNPQLWPQHQRFQTLQSRNCGRVGCICPQFSTILRFLESPRLKPQKESFSNYLHLPWESRINRQHSHGRDAEARHHSCNKVSEPLWLFPCQSLCHSCWSNYWRRRGWWFFFFFLWRFHVGVVLFFGILHEDTKGEASHHSLGSWGCCCCLGWFWEKGKEGLLVVVVTMTEEEGL